MLTSHVLTRLFQAAFWFCIVVILFLATTEGSGDMPTLGWDKLNHCFAFFVLFLLLELAHDWSTGLKIGFLCFFAIGIECIQYFLPTREFSLLDVIADIIGMGLYYILRKPLSAFNQSIINKLVRA